MPRAAQRLSQRGSHQPKEKGKKKRKKREKKAKGKKRTEKKEKKRKKDLSSPVRPSPCRSPNAVFTLRFVQPLLSTPPSFGNGGIGNTYSTFPRRSTKDTIRTSSSLLPFSSFLSLRFSFSFSFFFSFPPSPSSLSFDDDSTFDQRQIYVTADPPNQGGSTSWACLGRNEKEVSRRCGCRSSLRKH